MQWIEIIHIAQFFLILFQLLGEEKLMVVSYITQFKLQPGKDNMQIE